MATYRLSFVLTMLIILVAIKQRCRGEYLSGPSIFDNYNIRWGPDHLRASDNGRDVQIFLDQSSGSAFESKRTYGPGSFHMRIKVPGRNSAGVVTAFYLFSDPSYGGNDELDFEFLGNEEGKPVHLQTNVFTDGIGSREQRLQLWFDPTADFHDYTIFWNQYMIVFYVDNYPIRVFKNNRNIGVGYPSKPMKVSASIWNGDSWATNGGQTKINWAYAPFTAGYRDFSIQACAADNPYALGACNNPNLWWNREQYRTLNPTLERKYQLIKRKYMTYDYCTDRATHPTPPPECGQ